MTADIPTPGTTAEVPGEALVRLADVHGIATEYWSFFGERVHVPAPTLRAVLTAMGVAAETDAQVVDALADADERSWLALLPASLARIVGDAAAVIPLKPAAPVAHVFARAAGAPPPALRQFLTLLGRK